MVKVEAEIPVSHVVLKDKGITFEVRDSGNRSVGRLLVTRTGVTWAPKRTWLRGQRVQSRRKNWEQLHRLFYP